GPSASQADVSTNDVNRASSVPLQEEPSPSPPSPPPAPASGDALQALPSSNEAEVTSTTWAVTPWDDESIMDAEFLSYVEQFPQKIIIPFTDLAGYLSEFEGPLNASQCSSTTTLGPPADDLVCHPEGTESAAQVASAEQVC
ncbi:hypothetical protein N332_05217, partial [Mesitornis unicolor]